MSDQQALDNADVVFSGELVPVVVVVAMVVGAVVALAGGFVAVRRARRA